MAYNKKILFTTTFYFNTGKLLVSSSQKMPQISFETTAVETKLYRAS